MSTVYLQIAEELEALAAKARVYAEQEARREEARVWLTRHFEEFYLVPVLKSYPLEERQAMRRDLEAVRQGLLLKLGNCAPEHLVLLIESEHLLPLLGEFATEGPFARMSRNCHLFLSALIEELISEVSG